MREFNYKTAQIVTEIENTAVFLATKEICPDYSEAQQLMLTSYLGLTISLATADSKIFQSEIDFIVKSLPKNLKLSDNEKDALVQMNVMQATFGQGYSVTTPYFCEYLKTNMNAESKANLVKLLFKLCYIDGDFSDSEKEMIKTIFKRLGATQEMVNAAKEEVSKFTKSFSEEDRGTEVTFTKTLLKVTQKPQHKRYLRTVKKREIVGQLERVKKSPLYPYVERLSEQVDEMDLLFITCYLSVGFTIIGADDDIHEKEVAYLRSQFREFYELRGKFVDSYINTCIYLCEQKRFDQESLDDYIFILSRFFDKEERKRFALVLFNLADSDDEVSPLEMVVIEKILEHFEIEDEEAESIKDSALGIDGSFRIMRAASAWDMANAEKKA